ncbi:hypothetical protein [Variovorax paradoxus]|uniref:Uncharacterized protein n=1 Tax=Variovorax paradoxus (strain EPS) TaxID=595537 RepID=E6V259_VARPE|nr:hypothetical protein [Variovorax paradoxus]ADU39138.1 hypothetical protein Varpa_4978 [Variovorax paradoxus EPS]
MPEDPTVQMRAAAAEQVRVMGVGIEINSMTQIAATTAHTMNAGTTATGDVGKAVASHMERASTKPA